MTKRIFGTPEERFWPKVDKGKPDDCWEWKAYRDKDGYGSFKFNKMLIGAHRFAWILAFGEIPKGLHICHRCDNPPCCNPSHLFSGSAAQNNADRDRKGRGRWARGTHQHCAKLTEESVREIRKLYSTGNYTQQALGRMFNVNHRTVGYAVHRKTWAWLA